jgi:diaminopimelate epimerase
MSIPFIKAQATGNDFIFLKKEDLKSPLTPEKISQLCSRRFGIGADGLVIVDKTGKDVDFSWDFYNSDGGGAEMCGNAARCATLFGMQEFKKSAVSFLTSIGVVRGQVLLDGTVEVGFQIPESPLQEVLSPCGGLSPKGYLVNTGVPHCVIPHLDPWSLQSEAARLAPYIYSPEFGKKGANLTFVDWSKPEKLRAITLERGVNDFTFSCGTGVIAAGLVHEKVNGVMGWKTLSTPGGDLRVRTVSGAVSLSGPAQLVYKGEI